MTYQETYDQAAALIQDLGLDPKDFLLTEEQYLKVKLEEELYEMENQ